MGHVTIINKTNVTINSCISAGVNYSWVNKLSPKQFYEHDGAAGVYTLSVNYWFGESTEFSNSAAEIGVWVAGLVIGVAGIIALPFTGGTSGGLTMAAIAALSAIGAGAGLSLTGISIAIDDFRNEPSKWTNIHALENRRFIATAKVESKYKDGVLTFTEVPTIELSEITEAEFQRLIKEEGYVSYQRNDANAAPLPTTHAQRTDLVSAKLLSTPLRFLPSLGGHSAWEVENDQTSDESPMQIWDRNDVEQTRWTLEPVGDDKVVLYNRKLDRYATWLSKSDKRITSCKKRTDFDKQLFFVGLSGGFVVFFPAHDPTVSVISESGNLGNSTKLVVAPNIGPNPAFARWRAVHAG